MQDILNPTSITWIAISPDNHYLLTLGNTSTSVSSLITIWDIKTAKKVQTLLTPSGNLPNVAVFSPDGKYVFAGLGDRVVLVFDVQSGTVVQRHFLPSPAVSVLYISPDGKYLFLLSSPQSISWINTEFIEDLKPQANTGFKGSVPISPDTVNQVELLGTLIGHTNKVLALAFSSNGIHIASDSLDKTIRLWGVRSGQSGHTFAKGESEMIITNSIAFSPDGSLLASVEAIWDVKSGNIVHTLNRGQHAPVAFSPDGSMLVVALLGQSHIHWHAPG